MEETISLPQLEERVSPTIQKYQKKKPKTKSQSNSLLQLCLKVILYFLNIHGNQKINHNNYTPPPHPHCSIWTGVITLWCI